MREPNRKVKRPIVSVTHKGKPQWIYYPARGWLGSGLADCNDVEIYEGDRIMVLFANPDGEEDYTDTVVFKRGMFMLEDTDEPLADFAPNVEVIGHIAED